ncbi:MAG: hypothetical protein K2L92_09735 [Muribaculaceae bacterium]|nr:hypothetical protein [Muribaculaceae bacterium]
MALSLPQQLWLKRAYVGDIVEKLRLQVFTLDDLRDFALANPAFSEKLALVETSVKNLENPAELEEYNAVKKVLADTIDVLSEEKMITSYISRWKSLPSAEERVAEVKSVLDRLSENRRYEAVKTSAVAFLRTEKGDIHSIVADLDAFISDYAQADYAIADVERCRSMKASVTALADSIVAKRWNELFDDKGILKNSAEAVDFLKTVDDSGVYAERTDDAVWQWALAQEDIVAAVEEYEKIYGGNGRHSADAAEVYNARSEWNRIDSTNIYDLLEFLDYYPNHIFTGQAVSKLAELKASELESMRRSPALYDNQTFCALYRNQICTKEELCSACGADDALFERIMADSKIRATLPSPPGSKSRYSCGKGESGLTDVIFFGVAASGKTSVLSGLLSHDSVTVDEANYSGEYASVLKRYARAGVAISGTPDDFVAVVKATVTAPGGRRRSFNLVEMAGEAFLKKIVAAEGRNGRKTNNFELMENSASALLTGNNEKLIFLLVDPVGDRFGRQDQIEAFNRLRSLMFDVEANSDVMKRVKGLHFIVTKADTLGADRLEKARDIVREILNPATRDELVRQCRNYGINRSDDQALDGRPRVFCFSLGRFNVGNIYDYDPKDSGELLSVIGDYADRAVDAGFMSRLRDFLIKPFI